MTIYELKELCETLLANGKGNAEVRVGDTIESGPYLHASVGGIFESPKGYLVICVNDDEQWCDESPEKFVEHDESMKVLWKPPS